MESYSSLIEAFEALNERKRWNPESFTDVDWERWKEMRLEIESELFNVAQEPGADRRKFIRVPVTLEVRYWSRNELKDRYIPVLGEGGLFVATVDPQPVGTRLELEMFLASKKLSFKVKGEVVRIHDSDDPAKRGMGLKFVDLSYEQKRMIYGLVDDSIRQRLLERRRFARISVRLKVEFVYAEGHFELQTEDISLGGLFIATDHLVPKGERVRLALHLPGELPVVKTLAEVVWVVEEPEPGQSTGFAVRFIDLSEEATEAIRTYMSRRVADEIGPQVNTSERRRHIRLRRRVKLRFQLVQSFQTSYSSDISSGGVFIHTHEAPPLGSEISVTLVHPVTLQELELAGKVVRQVEVDPKNPSRVPGIGVAFEKMSEDKRSILQTFLRDFAVMEIRDVSPEES